MTPTGVFAINTSLFGAVAQLGERLNGIQEVRGSIPRSSTKIIKDLRLFAVSPFLCRSENVQDDFENTFKYLFRLVQYPSFNTRTFIPDLKRSVSFY